MPPRTSQPIALTTRADLAPNPRHANRGTPRGQSALTYSLGTYGAGRSILVDRHGHVIAGHKTLAEAQALQRRLTVVRTAGDALVVVQRTDLDGQTDPRAQQLAVADNRVAELGLAWDEDILRGLVAAGVELQPFWTDDEVAQLLASGTPAGRADADAVVAPPQTDLPRDTLFTLGPLLGTAHLCTDRGRVA